MINQYNDIWESRKAQELINTNPISAKLQYENYLEKYPYDYGSYKYYINVLCTLSEIDLAENIVNQMEDMLINQVIFQKELERAEKFKRDIIVSKLRILMHKEKYEEFYKNFLDNLYKLQDNSPEIIHMYCKKKLGILGNEDKEKYSYTIRQIIDYSESDFFEHIKKHFINYNNKNEGFVTEFPIYDVIKDIKKILPSNNRFCYDYLTDTYIFKYDNCGRSRDDFKLQDYFTLICFHNSNQMITMYPGTNIDPIYYTDLNYMFVNKENTKVKRISQIDKFYQKYKRK